MDCVYEKEPLGKPVVYSKQRSKVATQLNEVLVLQM